MFRGVKNRAIRRLHKANIIGPLALPPNKNEEPPTTEEDPTDSSSEEGGSNHSEADFLSTLGAADYQQDIESDGSDTSHDSEDSEIDVGNFFNMAELRPLLQELLNRLGQEGELTQMLHNQEDNLAAQQEQLANITQRQGMKSLEPKHFSGKVTDDPRKFMDRFEAHANLYRLNDHQKVLQFRLLLSGSADVWYTSLPARTRDNWIPLRASFLEAFTGQTTAWMLEQDLAERRQKPGESVDGYVTDILSVAQRLNKRDEETRTILVRGLIPSIKKYVLLANPIDLRSTIEKIRLGEAIAKMDAEPKASLSAISDYEELETRNLSLAAITNLENRFNRFQIETNKKLDGIASTEGSSRGFPQGHSHQGPRGELEELRCYNCDDQGHISRNCPRRQTRCQICNETDHTARTCPDRNQSGRSHYQENAHNAPPPMYNQPPRNAWYRNNQRPPRRYNGPRRYNNYQQRQNEPYLPQPSGPYQHINQPQYNLPYQPPQTTPYQHQHVTAYQQPQGNVQQNPTMQGNHNNQKN